MSARTMAIRKLGGGRLKLYRHLHQGTDLILLPQPLDFVPDRSDLGFDCRGKTLHLRARLRVLDGLPVYDND